MNDIPIRHAEPADYKPIIIVLDGWFDGRHVSGMLHKLFFIHFRETSFVVEEEGKLVGFLVGFLLNVSFLLMRQADAVQEVFEAWI